MPEPRKMKGIVISGLVKALRRWRRDNGVAEVPGLATGDLALLHQRVLVSSWYDHDQYLRLLRAAFRFVCSEDPFAFAELVKADASVVYAGPQAPLIRKGDPERTARGIPLLWKSCHSFARPEVSLEPGSARVVFHDYDGVGELENTVNTLWMVAALEEAGARDVVGTTLEAPWTKHPRLVLELRWTT